LGFHCQEPGRINSSGGAGKLEKVHDALCAEARACLAAITTATDHGMMRVQLESDSKILVNLIDFDKSPGMFYLKKQSFFYPRNLLVLR